jgi:hypothetical protein
LRQISSVGRISLFDNSAGPDDITTEPRSEPAVQNLSSSR